MAVEAIRTIKQAHVLDEQPGARREIDFARTLFEVMA